MAVQIGSGGVEVAIRQAAADALSARLSAVADQLAASGRRPRRVIYGPTRGTLLNKRRSPKGFVLDESGPQLLLPDGRLWLYHTRRTPEGIYYDARVDHARSMHGSIPLDHGRFSFLGAVVRKYHFGYRHADGDDGPDGFELGAITGKDVSTPTYVSADAAIADIVAQL